MHLKFMDIPLDGTIDQFQAKLLKKGVKLDFGNKGYSLFAYFFFKTKQIMSYLNAQGAKAAIPGINSKDIDSIMMPSLDNDCVKDYCNEVEDVITQILILSKESSRLSTLRDTLLPKLMSGQIKL